MCLTRPTQRPQVTPRPPNGLSCGPSQVREHQEQQQQQEEDVQERPHQLQHQQQMAYDPSLSVRGEQGGGGGGGNGEEGSAEGGGGISGLSFGLLFDGASEESLGTRPRA